MMLAEFAAKCFHNIAELALVTARIRHEIGHQATHLLPGEVGIVKFRAADVCAKDREKYRNEGFAHGF